MKKSIFYFMFITALFALAACGPAGTEALADEGVEGETAVTESTNTSTTSSGRMGMGMGNGMGGMMARHHATIPAEYAGMINPIPADEASIERGAEIYTTHCASCHGDGGMGDGPAAASLDPAPAPIAHTSQMLGDDYLFWRITEGGHEEPFNSGMVAWDGILEEETRWDLINYMRALGSGNAMPRQGMGGAAYDPAVEAEMQAEMLADAVAQDVISEEEAAVFTEVHELVDGQMMQNRGRGGQGNMGNGMQNRGGGMNGNMNMMMADSLTALVAAGEITQAQAETFANVHDRLVEAGLMQ